MLDKQRGRDARLVARQVSAITQARWQRWKEMVDDDRLPSVVFEVVLSAGIEHLPRGTGIEAARDDARPVSVTAIAQSMRLPPTTVRRQAAMMVEAGLMTRAARGVRIAPDLFDRGRIADIAAADTRDLTRCLNALTDAGYPPALAATSARVTALSEGVISRAMLTLWLRAMETFTELYDDIGTGTIIAAIISANVRHITEDPVLARRYADEDAPPPDAIRRPISLRALARAMDLPFETIRRRVAGLIADGRVHQRDDGVIVPAQLLLNERHLDNNRRIALHFDQMLATLVLLSAEFRARSKP